MFIVSDRMDKIRVDSDMTINEGAILKPIRKLKDFLAHFRLSLAKGKFTSRHFLKLRLYPCFL